MPRVPLGEGVDELLPGLATATTKHRSKKSSSGVAARCASERPRAVIRAIMVISTVRLAENRHETRGVSAR